MKTEYKNKWNSNDWKNVLDSNVPFTPKIERLEMRSDEFRHVRCIIPEHCFNDKYFEKYNGIEYDLYNEFNLICVFEYVNDVFEKGTMKTILNIVNLMAEDKRVQNVLKKFDLTTEQFGNMYQFGKVNVDIKQKIFIPKDVKVKNYPGPFAYQGSKVKFSTKLFNRYLRGEHFDNYYEPFLGSGSLAMQVMNNKIANNYYLSDINPFLIEVWNGIKFPNSYEVIYKTIEEFYEQTNDYNFDYNNSKDITNKLEIYSKFMKDANDSDNLLFKISANLIWMVNAFSSVKYLDKNGIIDCISKEGELKTCDLCNYKERQFNNRNTYNHYKNKFRSRFINVYHNQFKGINKGKKSNIENRLVNTHNLIKEDNVYIDCKDCFDILDNVNSDERNLIFLDPEYHNSKGKYGFDWNINDLDDLVNRAIELSKNKNNSILMTNVYETDYNEKIDKLININNFDYWNTGNKLGTRMKSKESNNKHEVCLSRNL